MYSEKYWNRTLVCGIVFDSISYPSYPWTKVRRSLLFDYLYLVESYGLELKNGFWPGDVLAARFISIRWSVQKSSTDLPIAQNSEPVELKFVLGKRVLVAQRCWGFQERGHTCRCIVSQGSKIWGMCRIILLVRKNESWNPPAGQISPKLGSAFSSTSNSRLIISRRIWCSILSTTSVLSTLSKVVGPPGEELAWFVAARQRLQRQLHLGT